MLKQAVKDQVVLVNRALGRIFRYWNYLWIVICTAVRYGPTFAVWALRSKCALDSGDFKALKDLLEKKINLMLNRPKSLVSRIFSDLEIDSVTSLTFAHLESAKVFPFFLKHEKYQEALDLFNYFRFFGDFRIACFLRKHLCHLCFEKQCRKRVLNPNLMNAILENGDLDIVWNFLESKHCRFWDKNYRDKLRALVSYLRGQGGQASLFWGAKVEDSDSIFLNLLKNKSIAIVGPAPTDDIQKIEIDSFDVVIRTNYRKGSNTPAEWYGSRTDVSYYNHYRISSKFEELELASEDLKVLVLKSKSDEEKVRSKLRNFQGSTRTANLVHELYFGGSAPMGIQIILGDVIQFSPKRIKIFCANFYCGPEAYGKNYKSSSTSVKTAARDLRIHEAFSCFSFIQNFYKRHCIEADSVTSASLKMSPTDYAERIQHLYGAFNVFSECVETS